MHVENEMYVLAVLKEYLQQDVVSTAGMRLIIQKWPML